MTELKEGVGVVDIVKVRLSELETLANYTSKDMTRYALNGICVDDQNLVATDGHMLCVANHVINTKHHRFIMPNETVSEVVRLAKMKDENPSMNNKKHVEEHGIDIVVSTFENDEKTYSVSFPSGHSLRFKPIEGVFPKYKEVLKRRDKANEKVIHLGTGVLKRLIKSAGKAESITFKITGGTDPARVFFTQENLLINALIMGVKGDDPEAVGYAGTVEDECPDVPESGSDEPEDECIENCLSCVYLLTDDYGQDYCSLRTEKANAYFREYKGV